MGSLNGIIPIKGCTNLKAIYDRSCLERHLDMDKYNDFRQALTFVLKWEGGYVNDPDDPGGETKWGISKHAHPELDIYNLTPEQCARIYVDDYWMPAGCDGMDFPLNVVVFDTAVNVGVNRAVQWARGSTNADEYLDKKKAYYVGLVNSNPVMRKYLRGWLNRLNDLKKFIEINHTESTSK